MKWFIRAVKFAFTGTMGKDYAGSRPLTDRERRSWLMGTYSLVAQVLYYQWKISQYEEVLDTGSEALRNELDILREENRRLIAENKTLRKLAMPPR